MQILRSILRLLPSPPAPAYRLSSAPPRWWSPALARRLFPLVAAPDPPVRCVSRIPDVSRNTVVSRVEGDESGKPYRPLPISSGKVMTIFQGSNHYAVAQGMKNINTENSMENIGTRSTILEVMDEEETIDNDDCRTTSEVIAGKGDALGRNVNLTGLEENINTDNSKNMENINTDNSKKVENIGTRGTILEVMDDEETIDNDDCRPTSEVIAGKGDTLGRNVNLTGLEEGGRSATDDQISVCSERGYTVNNVLAESRHRDGSIYKDMDLWWKTDYRIADRNETRLEAMAFTDPTDCIIHNGTCMEHQPRRMLQIFSLEVAEIHVDGGLVELYGYIAVRDDLDPLLNYVANISRDDPIIVEQGSLINMVGPKRGIEMSDLTLIEYDMRIKVGKQEKDDVQLIDGASLIGHGRTWNQPFTFHIRGDCGAVNLTLSYLSRAVEATVEVLILEVERNFSLSFGCLTSGLDVEIQLFDGAITESCGLKRSVVAVVKDSLIDVKFKVGALSSSSHQYSCSFKGKTHGHDTQGIKTEFALISVKVTWSTLPRGFSG